MVPYVHGMPLVGNKWVFKTKYKVDGSVERLKARLVAKGFHQTAGVDFTETFSPVVKPATIRIVLALALSNNWIVQQFDFSKWGSYGRCLYGSA